MLMAIKTKNFSKILGRTSIFLIYLVYNFFAILSILADSLAKFSTLINRFYIFCRATLVYLNFSGKLVWFLIEIVCCYFQLCDFSLLSVNIFYNFLLNVNSNLDFKLSFVNELERRVRRSFEVSFWVNYQNTSFVFRSPVINDLQKNTRCVVFPCIKIDHFQAYRLITLNAVRILWG